MVRATRRHAGLLPALALVVAMGAAGCGAGPSDESADGPMIVVTTGIWGDVVARVACDPSVTVEVLIPDGADAHGFEPSLADRARLDDAALVVANGLLLEEGLLDAIEAVESAGTPVFRFGDHVETLDYHSSDLGDGDDHDDDHEGEGDEHDDEAEHDDGGHDHEGGIDPHIWFDPTRVAQALPALADALVEQGGLDRATVDGCADGYRSELAGLDEEVVDLVSAVPVESRLLVTSHDALGYFADRYGFEVLATVSPSPSGLAETNPARLEELVATMEEAGVVVVFADAQGATDDAEALARQVDGGEVVVLATGALGRPGEGADSYVALVRSVATSIGEALAP